MIKQTLLCAIDIETSGPNIIKNGILSIGICAGTITGEIVVHKRIDVKLHRSKSFDTKTWDDFWCKNKKILEIIQEHPLEECAAIIEFINIIDILEDDYKVIIISDNPVFDFGFINYYLAFYINRLPLHYDKNGSFRPVYDTDSYSRGVLGKNYNNIFTDDKEVIKKLNIQLPPTDISKKHLPEYDAEYIYQLHRMVLIKN
jgi:hypothetical protein